MREGSVRDREREGTRGRTDDEVTDEAIQELMKLADRVSNVQVSFVRPQSGFNAKQDLASIIYRGLAEFPDARQEELNKCRQRYAESVMNQSGQLTEARKVFKQLVDDHKDRDEDIVPYAINVLFLAHIDILQGDTSGRVRSRVQDAKRMLGANNQELQLGWAYILEGAIELAENDLLTASYHISKGINLLQSASGQAAATTADQWSGVRTQVGASAS